jgi:hypothetical protein
MFDDCVRQLNQGVLRELLDYEGEYGVEQLHVMASQFLSGRPRVVAWCAAQRGPASVHDAAREAFACDALSNWLRAERHDVVDEATAIFVLSAWATRAEAWVVVDLLLAATVLARARGWCIAGFAAEMTCDSEARGRCHCRVIRACAAACDHDNKDANALLRQIALLSQHEVVVRAAEKTGVDVEMRMREAAGRWGLTRLAG